MFYYTISPIGSCIPKPPLNGKLLLYNYGGSQVVQTVPVNVPLSITKKANGTISLNSATLAPGRYLAEFYFSSSDYEADGATNFYMIQPAKILISNFTVQPSNTPLGSTISLIQTISNGGGLAAVNATLNIGISGPNTFFDFVHQKLSGLGTNAIQTVETQLVGDSDVAGIYIVSENVSYSSNLTVNNVTYSSGPLLSNLQRGSYAVFYNRSSAYNFSGGLPVPPASVGNITITSLPVYTSVLIGNSTTSYIGMTDAAASTTSVTLATPNMPYGRITTSTKAFTLIKGNSEYVQFVFTPYQNATPGVYVEPLYINTKVFGSAVNGTSSVVYLIFTLCRRTARSPTPTCRRRSQTAGRTLASP